MSVLQCDRNGCTNIMCDKYSMQYGYICDECFKELLNTQGTDINWFMHSVKQNHNKDEWERQLNNEFMDSSEWERR